MGLLDDLVNDIIDFYNKINKRVVKSQRTYNKNILLTKNNYKRYVFKYIPPKYMNVQIKKI